MLHDEVSIGCDLVVLGHRSIGRRARWAFWDIDVFVRSAFLTPPIMLYAFVNIISVNSKLRGEVCHRLCGVSMASSWQVTSNVVQALRI